MKCHTWATNSIETVPQLLFYNECTLYRLKCLSLSITRQLSGALRSSRLLRKKKAWEKNYAKIYKAKSLRLNFLLTENPSPPTPPSSSTPWRPAAAVAPLGPLRGMPSGYALRVLPYTQRACSSGIPKGHTFRACLCCPCRQMFRKEHLAGTD